jgi:FkbM family methyltransferase
MKSIVKQLLRSIGYDLHRLAPAANPAFQLVQGLMGHDIDLVLDVGANTGQFAKSLRLTGYTSTIVSFEPLSQAHAQLVLAASGDASWHVGDRCAIGESCGSIDINVAGNSVSSSVLPMLECHSSAAVGSAYISKEATPMNRLDAVAAQYVSNARNPFVKIDTQGFEWQVLNGAPETLARTRGIVIELSLVPLYSGQRLWRDLVDRLDREGFALWGIQPGFVDPRDGRTLQIDAVFFR